MVRDAASWTPAFAGSTTAGTPTYTTQAGRYWKIASLVLVQFSVVVSALGGAAGNALITGLPYTSNANPPEGQGFLGKTGGITADATKPMLALIVAPSDTKIQALKENGAPLVIGTDIAATLTLEGFLLYSV